MGVLVPGKIKNVAAVLMQAVPFCDGVGFHVQVRIRAERRIMGDVRFSRQVRISDGGALVGEVGVPDKEK
jgi:hypothetical protein